MSTALLVVEQHRAEIVSHVLFIFFFQAEDGIRDVAVTGVQTCALPISSSSFFTRDIASVGRCSTACGHSMTLHATCAKKRRRWRWFVASSKPGSGVPPVTPK